MHRQCSQCVIKDASPSDTEMESTDQPRRLRQFVREPIKFQYLQMSPHSRTRRVFEEFLLQLSGFILDLGISVITFFRSSAVIFVLRCCFLVEMFIDFMLLLVIFLSIIN